MSDQGTAPADAEDSSATARSASLAEEELPTQVWVMSPAGALEWSNDIGLSLESVHPDDATGATAALRDALTSGQPVERQLRMRCPSGTYHWAKVRAWPVRGEDGAVEHWVGLATDIESQARREALLDAVVAADAPVGIMLFDREDRFVRVSLPAAFEWPIDPSELEGRTLADVEPEVWEQMRHVHAELLAGAGPQVLEVTRTDGEREFHRLLLYYPARIEGELIGSGIVDIDITARNRAQLAAAGLADERRELLQALVQAQERERRRIAADIHGDTLQLLGALRLRVDALGASLAEPEQRAALAELDEAFELANQRLRALLFELWPPSLERAGLAEAISELLANFERDGGLRTQLRVELEHELPLELRGVIYRVLAEALTNVRRHAQASMVEVALTEQDREVLARIHDDGVGFDPAAARFGHVGLREMSDRVQAAGGTISIVSAPGIGTTIDVTVPTAAV